MVHLYNIFYAKSVENINKIGKITFLEYFCCRKLTKQIFRVKMFFFFPRILNCYLQSVEKL